MIERRWRAVEADIQRFYGLDARTLGSRRLLTLVEGLPAGARSTGGGGWFMEHELAAVHLEKFIEVHSKKKRGSKPFRVPRPEPDVGPKKVPIRNRLLDLKRQLKGR